MSELTTAGKWRLDDGFFGVEVLICCKLRKQNRKAESTQTSLLLSKQCRNVRLSVCNLFHSQLARVSFEA